MCTIINEAVEKATFKLCIIGAIPRVYVYSHLDAVNLPIIIKPNLHDRVQLRIQCSLDARPNKSLAS